MDMGLAVEPGWRVREASDDEGVVGYTLIQPDGRRHVSSDRYLARFGTGTARAYAYALLKHFRWLDAQGLTVESVSLDRLRAYARLLDGTGRGLYRAPRVGADFPLAPRSARQHQAALAGFYRSTPDTHARQEILRERAFEHPSGAASAQILRGGAVRVERNPLRVGSKAARLGRPAIPTGEEMRRLEGTLASARERFVYFWLLHAGLRVGELCGMRHQDVHLSDAISCTEETRPHVHIFHRDSNPNGARAKTATAPRLRSDRVQGGERRLVSPAMEEALIDYLGELSTPGHSDFVLINTCGSRIGEGMTTEGVRRLVARMGKRAGLPRLRPHQFRHRFATDLLNASGGDAEVARYAGGWSSTAMVEQVYGHVDAPNGRMSNALEEVWGR